MRPTFPYRAINITYLLKDLPKTTGNGPFAAKTTTTSISKDNLITVIPANTQVNLRGFISAIYSTEVENFYKKLKIVDDGNTKRLVTETPISVILENHLSSKITSLTSEWQILNQTHVVQEGNRNSGPVVSYDSSITLDIKESIYIAKSQVIALKVGQPLETLRPKIRYSIFLSTVSERLSLWKTRFGKSKISLFFGKYWQSGKNRFYQKIHKNDKIVWDNFKYNVRYYNHLIKTKSAQFFTIKREPLAKITGPAEILLRK